MKTLMYKAVFFSLLVSVSAVLSGQEKVSKVEFEGDVNEIITATSANPTVSGTLSSGEQVQVICAKGECNLVIDYKGRTVKALIGDRITIAKISEYDFGGDEDMELVVVNDYKGTAVVYVFAYARGIIGLPPLTGTLG